jgi:hypothetical protein
VATAINNSEMEKKMDTAFWWANLKETDHLEDLGVDGEY